MGGRRVKGKAGPKKAKKKVTTPPGVDVPSNRHLIWRFGRLDHGGKFACQTLAGDDVQPLERELAAFQNEPIWSLQKKKWLKFISVAEMTADGRRRLAKINKQEDGLWQLHLHQKKWRVWGYFEDPEFFFLWWDSNHAVATGKSRKRKA